MNTPEMGIVFLLFSMVWTVSAGVSQNALPDRVRVVSSGGQGTAQSPDTRRRLENTREGRTGTRGETGRFYFPPPGKAMENQDRRRPEEVGLDPEMIVRLREFVRNNPYPGRSDTRWALWRHGYLVHVEGDFHRTVDVASLRKTWHALAVGAAIRQGKIPSLDQPIRVYEKDLGGNDAEATWRHVITQSAGFDYPYGDYPDFKPGQMWTYSDYNPIRLCNALARAYGKKDYHDRYEDVLKQAYFDAIGMEGWSVLSKIDSGSRMEDGIRISLSLEHMGRLGLLVLARGTWDGKELIPRWFVEELETKQTRGMQVNYSGPNDGRVGLDPARFPECPYGYMTWVNTDGDYFPGADRAWAWGSGAGGTKIMWNRNNGIVFAGVGISADAGKRGIPHVIEEGITDPNPLAGISSTNSAGEPVRPRTSDPLPRLRVSENGRFLVTEDGSPFFWLGDTSWAVIQKYTREDTDKQPSVLRYFRSRADKRFNVLQCRLAEDARTTDSYGHKAFVDGRFDRPKIVEGRDNDYWDTADWFVAQAGAHGLYLALLPTWFDSVPNNDPMIEDPTVAYRYGHFIGARYGNKPHIVWVLGGDPDRRNDRDVDHPPRLAATRALAEGIADATNGVDEFDGKADYSTTLMTYHPRGGGQSSSRLLHNEPWLDFNMIQTTSHFVFTNYRTVGEDYAKQPAKPTLEAEVAYEYSVDLSRQKELDKRIGPWHVRKAAYWNVFAGGFGFTYGHRSYIGWVVAGETLRYGADIPWFESLDAPGAFDMTHLRDLMESRPFLTRVPDQTLVVEGPSDPLDYVAATQSADGSYAMLYFPTGKPATVQVNKVTGDKVRAWWFNPREGNATEIGQLPTKEPAAFVPPSRGEDHDWVLVLEDASKGFPPPGQIAGAGGFVSPTGWPALPERIGRGAYPDIAIDATGGLHVVYVREGTLRYLHRPAGPRRWSLEEDTGLPQGMVHRSDPEIALDAGGRLHALVGSTVARREAGKWRPLHAAFQRDTDLALNSRGEAFIVRRGGHGDGFLGLLKCLPDLDTFTPLPDPDIAAGFPAGSNDHVYGSISVSPADDSLHIVYRHGTPKSIAYRISTDGGKTWQGGGITDTEPEAPSITVSREGQVFVANADGHVFRRGAGPDRWIDLGRAFQGGRRDLPEVVVDRLDAVHVVAFGGQYNRFANGRWDGARTLPSRGNSRLGYADMAEAPDGAVWIAYEEGDAVRSEELSGESDILLLELPPITIIGRQ